MQHKNLQSLLSKVTSQPDADQDVEVLTQELASQLKSGAAHSSESLLVPEPVGLWRTISPWLHRVERVLTSPGRSGRLMPGRPASGD